MTLLSATCAIVDDLVESGSFLRTQVSACDFGVLDNAPACAVTVRPGLSTFDYIGYGGVRENTWGFKVQGWVKDSGDVIETLANVVHLHDSLLGAINGGCFANCASLTTRVQSITHSPENIWDIAGNDYFLVEAMVTSREDP